MTDDPRSRHLPLRPDARDVTHSGFESVEWHRIHLMALVPTTIDRLVFVRQLYLKGMEETHQSFPLSATAILTFHDAIEIFFVLAAEEKSATFKTNTPFMNYFEAINQAIGSQPLYHKPSIARLNEARRGLKHGVSYWPPRKLSAWAIA